MDGIAEYIWQRRIHRDAKYGKRDVLYPESVRLGLEFNAALEKKEKFDASLLTNAVVLELCDFAKRVSTSEAQFLVEILEFNFDLGVGAVTEAQYVDFQKAVLLKTKLTWNALKNKHEKWRETFTLPQLVDEKALKESERRESNETFDDSLLAPGSEKTQTSENQDTDKDDKFLTIRGQTLSKPAYDSFTHCRELGVKLFIQEENAPKEKLPTERLTKGVMMELLNFSKVLCGIRSRIVYDLVKLNFSHELGKVLFYSRAKKMVERQHLCQNEEDKAAFRKELFPCHNVKQGQPQKRKNLDMEELLAQSKRWLSSSEFESNGAEKCQDVSYMCPIGFEEEMISDAETEQEIMMTESGVSETSVETFEAESAAKMSAEAEETQVKEKIPGVTEKMLLEVAVKEEEEEAFVSSVQPQIQSLDSQEPVCHENSSLTVVADQFPADEHQHQRVQTPKQKFWIRRTLRIQQILHSSKVTDRFASCRAIGFNFDVGAGSKQNLSLELLTNSVMCEVHKFASCMQKSMHGFLSEILENNFNVLFKDEAQQRYFTTAVVSRERFYQSQPGKHSEKFLNSSFKVQESFYKVDVGGDCQTGEEQGECDSETNAKPEQEGSERHPFCRKLGLDLWSMERRPAGQKIDLVALTKGTVMEMMNYIRYLCGNIQETVIDLLEHNFDLDLQDTNSHVRKLLQNWYRNHKNDFSKYRNSKMKMAWLKKLVFLHPASEDQHQQTFETCPEDPDSTMASKGNVARPKSCYGACEEIGLHLSMGAKPKTRRKLHPGVLTRRLLFEIHQYVMRHGSHYIPALYQVLENNFDLSSQRHRKVEFAWAVSSQVLGIARKVNRKGSYLDKAVELPLEHKQVMCKEEPEDDFTDRCKDSDVTFVQELKPVDIEVEIE